jgi:hypothetical protein
MKRKRRHFMKTVRSNVRGDAFSRGSVGKPIPMIEPFSGERSFTAA